jgi:phage tail protein X
LTTYRTKQGDVLDYVCYQYYGRQAEVTEAVLEANPHLADVGPILPAGLVIEMPELPEPEAPETVRLWD